MREREKDPRMIEFLKRNIYTYKGFLYIKCEKCGEIHAFCSRLPMDNSTCQTCGRKTHFHEPLKPLYINCECGQRSRYMTNLNEDLFDVPCIECKAPVAVTYNQSKKIYFSIC
jgi:ribosomal protein S27E